MLSSAQLRAEEPELAAEKAASAPAPSVAAPPPPVESAAEMKEPTPAPTPSTSDAPVPDLEPGRELPSLGHAGDPAAAGAGSPAPEAPAVKSHVRPPEPTGPWVVQVASTDLPEEAMTWKERFKGRFSDTRVDVSESAAGHSRYRVLVGTFKTRKEAERFVATAQLRGEVPDLWIHHDINREWEPKAPSTGADGAAPSLEAHTPTPPVLPAATEAPAVPLEVSLHCDGEDEVDGGARRYRTRVQVNPATGHEDMEVAVRWDCNPKRISRWSPPTHVGVVPQMRFLSTQSGASSASRASWGLGLEAYKNVGGWGPTLEYTFLRPGYMTNGSLLHAPFTSRHEARLGLLFPFSPRFSAQLRGGVATTQFLMSGTGIHSVFREDLLPVLGLRLAARLVKWEKGTEFILGGGYEYIFSAVEAGRSVYSGMRWDAAIRLRTSLGPASDAESFFGYESTRQTASDHSVAEGAWTMGVSIQFHGTP
ncbi:MAG TPA: SPOR domain-containing protein [Bdellovibrionota bacterium]|nr:SPOR domain-containing protein [Bdellovibrionota bacterium]